MIKAAIVGAGSRIAGELIRILMGHPDVDMTVLFAPALRGRPVSDIHHGLVGYQNLCFTDRLLLDELDVVFLCDDVNTISGSASSFIEADYPKFIFMVPISADSLSADNIPYGLSEINRKKLVRGATKAILPSLAASASLIALYPLASNLLLSSDLNIKVVMDPQLSSYFDRQSSEKEIQRQLADVQSSFTGNVSLDIDASGVHRQFSSEIIIDCALPIDEVLRIYNQIYDDHNFTHVVTSDITFREVVGTHRCVIAVSKPTPSSLAIRVEVDGAMRGGAGEAVHVMNLLFGLHEKIGLDLKASIF